MSWVQTVVRQVGPYLPRAQEAWGGPLSVREDRSGWAAGVPVVPPGAQLGS